MKPVWSPRARRDLRELITYIAEDSPQNADLVNERISKSVELLGDMPYAGRLGRIAGTHERVVSRTPFILVYRVDSEQVHILRVLRGARKWPGSISP
jgi:toxin ParE1/3/4